MNCIKENLSTIILIMLIIIIILGMGIFCWKIIQEDKTTNNIIEDNYSQIDNSYNFSSNSDFDSDKNITDNNELKKNIAIRNNYIDMSKYYLNSNIGKPAEVYNKMLDTLGKQSYISYSKQSIYDDVIYNSYFELDLKNYISKYEGEDSGGKSIDYKYWIGTLETNYNYYEARGTWKKSTFNWWERADFIYEFLGSEIIILDDEYYEFYYEENVVKNDNNYYKITVKYSGDEYWKKQTMIMYIEADTMMLKEVEITSETIINNTTINGQDNYQLEYSDKVLEIPDYILNMKI